MLTLDFLHIDYYYNAFVYTLFIGSHCVEGRIEEAIELMQDMENAVLMKHLIFSLQHAPTQEDWKKA